MLAETAASSDTNYAGGNLEVTPHTEQEESTNKKAWITSMLNAVKEFPEFKAAVWFEEIKPESVPGGRCMRDFRITKSADLRRVFLEGIEESERKNIFVDGIVKNEVYKCSGALNF
jgi:hypothetical protein